MFGKHVNKQKHFVSIHNCSTDKTIGSLKHGSRHHPQRFCTRGNETNCSEVCVEFLAHGGKHLAHSSSYTNGISVDQTEVYTDLGQQYYTRKLAISPIQDGQEFNMLSQNLSRDVVCISNHTFERVKVGKSIFEKVSVLFDEGTDFCIRALLSAVLVEFIRHTNYTGQKMPGKKL